MGELIELERFDCLKFGTGGNAFVIIPGLSIKSVLLSGGIIERGYKAISDGYTVYVFDRRKIIPEGYDISGMAEDTAIGIKELGIEPANVFGASQGGMIALALALNYPETVKTLMLGSSSARVGERTGRIISEWISLAKAREREKLYISFCEKIYPPKMFEEYLPVLKELSATVTDEELDRFVSLAPSVQGFDVLSLLSKISVPVCVLGSSDDDVLGGEAVNELIGTFENRGDFEYHVYSSYGHASFDTAPDYKDRLRLFLDRYN